MGGLEVVNRLPAPAKKFTAKDMFFIISSPHSSSAEDTGGACSVFQAWNVGGKVLKNISRNIPHIDDLLKAVT